MSSFFRAKFYTPKSNGGSQIDSYKIEYAEEPFQDEVQTIQLTCAISSEVQNIETSAAVVPEIQIVHARMSDSYVSLGPFPTQVTEVQTVSCDASGGSFTLNFNGEITDFIPWNASALVIELALEELFGITDVTVTFPGGVSAACSTAVSGQGWTVLFNNVVHFQGDLPMLIGDNVLLLGLRRIDITESIKGIAGMSGSFRLRYRGLDTGSILYSSSASVVESELNMLATIGTGGVTVTSAVGLVSEYAWYVSFIGLNTAGNVEPLQVIYLNYAHVFAGVEILCTSLYSDRAITKKCHQYHFLYIDLFYIYEISYCLLLIFSTPEFNYSNYKFECFEFMHKMLRLLIYCLSEISLVIEIHSDLFLKLNVF